MGSDGPARASGRLWRRRAAAGRGRRAAARLPGRLRGAPDPLSSRQRAVRAQRRPAREPSRRRRCCARAVRAGAVGAPSAPAGSSTRRCSARSRPPATRESLRGAELALAEALRGAPPRARRPRRTPRARWRACAVDDARERVAPPARACGSTPAAPARAWPPTSLAAARSRGYDALRRRLRRRPARRRRRAARGRSRSRSSTR